MDRRSFVIGATATALAARPALAQEAFPARAITIINAFPPGGLNDIVTRPLATALEQVLKQPVVVDTKAGAAGQVGAQVAASAKATGPLKLRRLPTNGGGPAITAALGNNAQVTTQSVSATLPHIKAGKLRPLANFAATRSKVLPDVPTLKELGYDVEYYLWVGIF